MLKITVGTNTNRKTVMATEDTTLLVRLLWMAVFCSLATWTRPLPICTLPRRLIWSVFRRWTTPVKELTESDPESVRVNLE